MPQRELIGPNAPEEAARPLTGTEVLHVVDEDGNSKVTTTAAIAEDLGSGGASAITSPDASAVVTALDGGQVLTTIDDVPVETVELAQRLLRHVLESGRTVEASIGDTHNAWGVPVSGLVELLQSPGAPALAFGGGLPDPLYTYAVRVLGDASALGGANEGLTEFVVSAGGIALRTIGRVGSALGQGFATTAPGMSGEVTSGSFAEIIAGVARLRVLGQLYLQNIPDVATPAADSMLWVDSTGVVHRGPLVPIADLVKRLGDVFTLSVDTVLDDSYSGGTIFTDTSGGARQHTIPTTVSAGWNAVFVREGANTLKVIGDGTMLMKGPAAAANEVAIAVDDGGVSVLRRSATKCWCAGKIS